MSEYLFTYGTLKPGLAPGEIAHAVEKLSPVGKGIVYGSLYDLGDFPGAVLDPSSKNRILGTVFRLSDDPSILQQLDEYEEYDPNAPDTSLFRRELHSVELASGGKVECWVYIYNGEANPLRLIETGIFQREAV